jgi:hypothetical protein
LFPLLPLAVLGVVSCNGDESTKPAARPAAVELVHYDPVGDQSDPEDHPLAAASVGVSVTASSLTNVTHGYLSGINDNRRPVLMGVGPLNVSTSFYLSFTLTPKDPSLGVFLTSLTYTYASYYAGATGTISLRTSADGFATTLDAKAWHGNEFPVALTFDADKLPVVAGPLEIRLYMHDLVGGDTFSSGLPGDFPNPVDWADLLSTAETGGDGLRVRGGVVRPGG